MSQISPTPTRSARSDVSNNLSYSYNYELESQIGCSCEGCEFTFAKVFDDNKRLIDTIKLLRLNNPQMSATIECDSPDCQDTFAKLAKDNEKLQERVQRTQKTDPEMQKLYEIDPPELAVRRLPALSLTLVLEICGGIVIQQFYEVIQSLTLIVSFMPAISALSGNLGLQANSNTVRGLGTGFITRKNYCQNIKKEILSGLISATVVAIILSLIGLTWAYIEKIDVDKHSQNSESQSSELENICAKITKGFNSTHEELVSTTLPPIQTTSVSESPIDTTAVSDILDTTRMPDEKIPKEGDDLIAQQLCKGIISQIRKENEKGRRKELRGKMNPWLFGGIIFIGTWISMMISTVNGASCPILAHMIGVDPAKVSGPLETAFQDIVGQSFLLALAYFAFHCIQPII